jgi:hypothetical protein
MGYIRLYSKVIRGGILGRVGHDNCRGDLFFGHPLRVLHKGISQMGGLVNGIVQIFFQLYVVARYELGSKPIVIQNKQFTGNIPQVILANARLMLPINVDLLLNTIDNRSE